MSERTVKVGREVKFKDYPVEGLGRYHVGVVREVIEPGEKLNPGDRVCYRIWDAKGGRTRYLRREHFKALNKKRRKKT